MFCLVLVTIKKHKDFLCVLQNLCLAENNEVCFFTFKIIIKLSQLEEKSRTEGGQKLSVGFVI